MFIHFESYDYYFNVNWHY